MKPRRWVPTDTKAQLLHALVISFVGVGVTVLVAMIQLYFLDAVNTKFVSEVAAPGEVLKFLNAENNYIYYGLIAFLALATFGMLILMTRFTNRIFGPTRSLDREVKKQTFLGQFKTEVDVRKADLTRGLIRQYRHTCEDMDTVHKLYTDAYSEIDEALKDQESKKSAA